MEREGIGEEREKKRGARRKRTHVGCMYRGGIHLSSVVHTKGKKE